MKEKIKIAVAFNEAHPELYFTKEQKNNAELSFIPFFEVDQTTPIEEFEYIARKINSSKFLAFTFNLKDNLDSLIKMIKHEKPDVIFNFIELFNDNPRLEMNIVGLFELLDIPYTGASPMALSTCQSKILVKQLLKSHGILTPPFGVFNSTAKNFNHGLKYPLIVKPAYEDASVGIENASIVTNKIKLKQRVEYVLDYFKQPALVEEFIDGRELNISVMGDKNPFVLPISEIDFASMPENLHNIVSYQAKWDPFHEAYHKTIPICPAKLNKRIEQFASQTALKAFNVMGVRDYARVDIRLSTDNQLFVLEVNPNPDLTEGAGFMRSAHAAGLNYSQALKKIIMFAYERGKRK